MECMDRHGARGALSPRGATSAGRTHRRGRRDCDRLPLSDRKLVRDRNRRPGGRRWRARLAGRQKESRVSSVADARRGRCLSLGRRGRLAHRDRAGDAGRLAATRVAGIPRRPLRRAGRRHRALALSRGAPLGAVSNGAVFAVWPLLSIVFAALLLYNVSVTSGQFDALSDWIVKSLPRDRRVVLVVIGFSFSALLEGVAGFGTPVAIATSMLVSLGFPWFEAVVITLMFNTAPVAFAALGVPITVLSAVTHLPSQALASMVGRQLPFLAFLLPFYVTAAYGGVRSVRAVWPVLTVAGGSFALTQFLCSNFVSYPLTDVLSSIVSTGMTLLLLRWWQPIPDPRFALADRETSMRRAANASLWRACQPWAIVSLTVTIWTTMRVSALGEAHIEWPGLHNAVSITLYSNAPYAAIWAFQPLGTGTAIMLAAVITALVARVPASAVVRCAALTLRQIRLAALTIISIVGLAYLM